MPPSLVEWLPEDHLVWTVLGVVDQMDLGRFREGYRLGGSGRAPYDPAMLAGVQPVVATRVWSVTLRVGTDDLIGLGGAAVVAEARAERVPERR
jgi:hypothetical protein